MSDRSPGLDPKTAVTVGRIVAAHGIRGEVKVESTTDFPERFEPGSELWLRGRPVTVESSRASGKALYVKLAGVETRNEAEALRSAELKRPQQALEEGLFYRHDVIGLQARTAAGEILGRVADVLTTGSADVYVVRGRKGELLLPATDDVVLEIDIAKRRMVVELVEGLEFERRKAAPKRLPASRRAAGTRAKG